MKPHHLIQWHPGLCLTGSGIMFHFQLNWTSRSACYTSLLHDAVVSDEKAAESLNGDLYSQHTNFLDRYQCRAPCQCSSPQTKPVLVIIHINLNLRVFFLFSKHPSFSLCHKVGLPGITQSLRVKRDSGFLSQVHVVRTYCLLCMIDSHREEEGAHISTH